MPQAVHIGGIPKPIYMPDGMTPEQIQHAIETDILPEIQKSQAAPVAAPTGMEGFKRGIKDVGEGLEQKFFQVNDYLNNRANTRAAEQKNPAVTPGPQQNNAETQAAEANAGRTDYVTRRGKDAGFDWPRLGGNMAATAPAMLMPMGASTMLARMGAGAAGGGMMGATQFDPSNSALGAAKNVAVGAGAGAIVNPVAGWLGDKASAAFKNISGRVSGLMNSSKATPKVIEKAIPEMAGLTQEAKDGLFTEAIEQVKRTGQMDTEALRRKANMLANGVMPTKAMVTRNPMDWTKERNLQKMGSSSNDELKKIGEELTGVYQANDKALTGQLENLQTTLPKGTQEQLGERAMSGVGKVAEQSQKAVRAGYEHVDKSVGNELASDARNVYATITDPKLLYNPRSKPLVEAVQGYLKHMGMIDSKGALTSKSLTASENEQLRQFVNTLDDTFGRSHIIKAIDADAASGLGQDAYGAARTKASERFSTLDNPATQRALNTLGELQQGKTAQNFIKSQIVGGADQDVEALLKTVSTDPGARDAIQAGVLQHLEAKAVNPNSGQFSAANFNKGIIEIGDTKLVMIFGKEGAAKIKSLAQAGIDATFEPAHSAVNHSNSGTTMLGALADRAKGFTRYLQATPVLSHSIEVGKTVATQNSAQRQLAEALAGRANAPALPLNPRVKAMIDALAASATPGAVAVTNQARNQNKKGAKNE